MPCSKYLPLILCVFSLVVSLTITCVGAGLWADNVNYDAVDTFDTHMDNYNDLSENGIVKFDPTNPDMSEWNPKEFADFADFDTKIDNAKLVKAAEDTYLEKVDVDKDNIMSVKEQDTYRQTLRTQDENAQLKTVNAHKSIGKDFVKISTIPTVGLIAATGILALKAMKQKDADHDGYASSASAGSKRRLREELSAGNSVLAILLGCLLLVVVLVSATLFLSLLLSGDDDDKINFDTTYPIDQELGYCTTLAGDIV